MAVTQFGGDDRADDLTALVLHGPRLTLRPWLAGDAPIVHAVMADDRMRARLSFPGPYTMAHAVDFVTGFAPEQRAGGSSLECALVSGDDQLVGAAALRLSRAKQPASIGYW